MVKETEGTQDKPAEPDRRDWRAWLEKFRRPDFPQIGLMAGGAAILALGVALTLWLSSPSYQTLYRGLSEADAGQIMKVLQKENIPFKIDHLTGVLMVSEQMIHEVRLKLASQGLPQGAVNGFEMLDKQNGFGISQFMENARYQRALEGELARSVMSIGAVQNARVHLALPKDTVFVRNRQTPSASVLVQLHPGRVLDKGQVAAVVHLVSSSVPKLTAEQISVIDQMGNLLTAGQRDASLSLSLDQLEYTRRLEERYIKRIEDILTPILGMGRVRAQVALDVDFTVSEETTELFDPKQAPGMVRSEQISEESNTRTQPMGIPGALSNQPPGVATVAETVPGQHESQPPTDAQLQANNSRPLRERREATRNYELDKRISHIRHAPGRVRRISTAVVLDDRTGMDETGNSMHMALSAEEVDRMTALVKEAIGFDATRGDSLSVVNTTFANSPFEEGPVPFWGQAWLLELVKWAVIGLIAILVLFVVVRPLLRHLLSKSESGSAAPALTGSAAEGRLMSMQESGLEGLLEDRVELSGQSGSPLSDPVQLLDRRLKMAKALVAEDPKRAVQVIRNWMTKEG